MYSDPGIALDSAAAKAQKLPMAVDQQLADRVVAIAHVAGAEIMKIYATDFAVEDKADQSPLTAADMASHRAIVDGLEALKDGLPILSEESKSIAWAERKTWARYWLVDPLDGTKEFVKRNGEFTVNIALIADGRAVFGVVYAPVKDWTYVGIAGQGAYKISEGERHSIRVRSLTPGNLQVVGSRSHAGDRLQGYLDALGDHEIVAMGSSLKLCLVAEGAADLYPRLGPTSEWDTAAAQAVVEAAGGQVTDTQLRAVLYNAKESILNPDFLVFGDSSRDWRPIDESS